MKDGEFPANPHPLPSSLGLSLCEDRPRKVLGGGIWAGKKPNSAADDWFLFSKHVLGTQEPGRVLGSGSALINETNKIAAFFSLRVSQGRPHSFRLIGATCGCRVGRDQEKGRHGD